MIRVMFQRPELAPALRVFTQDVVVVGRGGGEGAAPDWVLPFADVSRLQCRFTAGGDAVFVEGLSERNATFVNNRRISAITRLKQGDVIRFGGCALRFVGTTPEGDLAARPAAAPSRAAVAVGPGADAAPRAVDAASPHAAVAGRGAASPHAAVAGPGAASPHAAVPGPGAASPRAAAVAEVPAAVADGPVQEDMSPILEQARRWELHGQPAELLLRGDALRRGRVWLRGGAALAGSGALVRRFVEASARRRWQGWVGAARAVGLALMTVMISFIPRRLAAVSESPVEPAL